MQAMGIDAGTGAGAQVTFNAQVPTPQLKQATLSYFGDDGQWHTAAEYNGSAWVQVGPSGDTPMNEQDAPAGPGLNTISLPLQFDDSSAPAVDDLSGTVFVLTVPAPISLNPVPGGTVDTPYAETIAASGGTGSITLAVSNVTGSIPGLSIPTGGTNSLTITGTPTARGTVSFTVAATDSVGLAESQSYTLAVTQADPSRSTISLVPASVSAGWDGDGHADRRQRLRRGGDQRRSLGRVRPGERRRHRNVRTRHRQRRWDLHRRVHRQHCRDQHDHRDRQRSAGDNFGTGRHRHPGGRRSGRIHRVGDGPGPAGRRHYNRNPDDPGIATGTRKPPAACRSASRSTPGSDRSARSRTTATGPIPPRSRPRARGRARSRRRSTINRSRPCHPASRSWR